MGSLREKNPSLWVSTTAESSYPALEADVDIDVVVVGAGITGLTAAVELAHQGRAVMVLEAGRVASGVTGYTTAKLTALHGLIYDDLSQAYGDDTALRYADANLAGIAKVATLADQFAIECDLETRAAFTYTRDEAMVDKVQAEVAAAERISLPASFTTETDLPYPVAAAIRLDHQAQFHPRKYCLGLAAAIVQSGGDVYERTRALSVDDDDDHCRVATTRGTVTANHVILTTHLPFSDKGAYFARSHPVRSYVLGVCLDGQPPRGMYLSVPGGHSVRSAVRDGDDDELILVGGESHKVGQDDDTRERYRALETWARQHFPVRSIDYRWSAQDYMPVDRLPFVGPLSPGSDRILVATGFQKWGMSNGTVAAMVLVDRVTGNENQWASMFDSGRLNVRQSVSEAVKENVDVARRFIGDRLRTDGDRTPDDLAPGEAAVLAVGTGRVAAYRDDAGTLHAVSPVCTHLGCTVTWNTAETTWDCPCHGSRYTCDGHVIQGPAVRDLEPWEPPT